MRTGADARSRRARLGKIRAALSGVGGTCDGLRHGRLLQLRHPDEGQDRRPSLRALLHRRSGLLRRRSRVGLSLVGGWWFVVGGWWFVVGSWELGIGSGWQLGV